MPYKNPPECSIADCVKPVVGRGWCTMHLKRWKRNGDPETVIRDWGHGKNAEHVSYSGAHYRVKKARGPAIAHDCAHCGSSAKHWAYDHADPAEVTGLVTTRGITRHRKYSLDPAHYIPLCQPCHRVFDGRGDDLQRDGRGRWLSAS